MSSTLAPMLALPPSTSLKSQVVDRLGHVALLRQVLGPLYKKRFDRAQGEHVRMFRGVYADFAAALRDVPQLQPAGCDDEASVQRVARDCYRIFPFDYPVLFWLSRLLPDCRLLFDWGGNVGISYFSYRGYLQYPPQLTWLVSDLPAAARAGQAMAAARGAAGLRFTTSLDELPDADLLLAAGSLHFIESPFEDLRRARSLPRHVLLNKVPLQDRAAAVTLQNMGTAFCPNHLFNRAEFLRRFDELGYEVADSWMTPDLSCRIPLFPAYSIPAYSGFYLRRR